MFERVRVRPGRRAWTWEAARAGEKGQYRDKEGERTGGGGCVKRGSWELGRGIWEGATFFIECDAFSFVFDGPLRGIRVVAAGGMESAVVVEDRRV